MQLGSMIVPDGFCVAHGPGCDSLHERRGETSPRPPLPTPTMEELVESGEFRVPVEVAREKAEKAAYKKARAAGGGFVMRNGVVQYWPNPPMNRIITEGWDAVSIPMEELGAPPPPRRPTIEFIREGDVGPPELTLREAWMLLKMLVREVWERAEPGARDWLAILTVFIGCLAVTAAIAYGVILLCG